MYPAPPWICTARSATRETISEQKYLAAEGPSFRSVPASNALATSKVRLLPARWSVTESAIMPWINWKLAIG